nr:hypothetical protein PECWAHUG_PECWAHUG_CDS_0018 [Microvirus sp.]
MAALLLLFSLFFLTSYSKNLNERIDFFWLSVLVCLLVLTVRFFVKLPRSLKPLTSPPTYPAVAFVCDLKGVSV